jgi:hypothetical protein
MTDKIQNVNPCPRDAWELFRAMFKDGDEVIVVDDDDQFHWGKLQATEDHCVLKRSGLRNKEIFWEDVQFISHDGFPCSKLLGADGSALIQKLDTRDPQRAIREAMGYRWCDRCEAWEKRGASHTKRKERTPVHQVVFRDPFLIEDVEGALVNPGIPWTEDNWQWEETLMLYAKDGARGLLWSMHELYHVDCG